jgi:hypothetical protein
VRTDFYTGSVDVVPIRVPVAGISTGVSTDFYIRVLA